MANETHVYDLVIVGAGPSGLSAAIYASRAMLDFVVLEQTTAGGQVLLTNDIDNYPGVPEVQGFELMDAFTNQAKNLGAEIKSEQVLSIAREGDLFKVQGAGESYTSKALIVATGAVPRHAGFEGEETFAGRGVSYCGTCDGMFYRDKVVYVIGGGNTAAEDALYLSRLASKVIMCVRKDHLRAQSTLKEELEQNDKVEIRHLTRVVSINGENMPSSITLHNNETGEETTETYDEGAFGTFVLVGHVPVTEVLEGLVEISDSGAVITNDRMETLTPGLFVAGDVREKPLRQIVTAAADGAVAATMAASYLGQPVEG